MSKKLPLKAYRIVATALNRARYVEVSAQMPYMGSEASGHRAALRAVAHVVMRNHSGFPVDPHILDSTPEVPTVTGDEEASGIPQAELYEWEAFAYKSALLAPHNRMPGVVLEVPHIGQTMVAEV